jgi:hypothetical protein
MSIQALESLTNKFLSGNEVQVERAMITRQEFLDIQQRINELENKLWPIEGGEHYIYPKGRLSIAAPFTIHDNYMPSSVLELIKD